MRRSAIMARLGAATVLAGVACVGENRPVAAPPGTQQEEQPSTANGPGDAAASPESDASAATEKGDGTTADGAATDGTTVWGAFDGPTENCRWEGYGIGPLGAGQCFIQHLLTHSAHECFTEGGKPFASRNIVDQCAIEADEVQILCCFADGVPAAALASVVFASSEVEMLLESVPPESRAEFLARAADTCTQRGMRLVDWSLRYATDGTTPDVLRFACL